MNSVPLLYFCGLKIINANQIHSDMHLVYGDKCFTKRTGHFWCKKVLNGQKFVSYTEVQSVVFQWHGQQPALFFALEVFSQIGQNV